MIAILDRNLNVLDRVQPEKMPLNLEERKSTASIDLPIDAPEIPGNAWLRDETEPGAGIIWREKTGTEQYDRETRTIQLEHIINTLKDDLIFGELTPAAISGISGATSCTAEQAARKVLTYQKQTIWVLGDFEYSVINPYSFNGENLFSALETITGSLEGAYWDFDLTRLPFRLHIRRLPSETSCEMRQNRNLTTIKKTVDRSRMYTRFYPVGKNNLHITGNYVSRNEDLYGTICKTETDQSKATEAELRAWANERLRNHCEPSVTVQGSGLELSQATGEPLDKLKINVLCRVPLPKYRTVITEKITKLSWPDKIKRPKEFNFTLANLIEDVASIFNSAAKAGARGGRTAAKQAEEDHAWFVDTTDHVAMVAEAVAGEGAAQDWSRVSQVVVDGEGIHQRVTRAEGDIVTAFTEIDANEERIKLEAQRATKEEGTLRGQLQVAADQISAEVSRATNKDVELEGKLIVEAGKSALVVSTVDTRQVVAYAKKSSFPATGSASLIYLDNQTGKYYNWLGGRYQETTPTRQINAGQIAIAINESGDTEATIKAQKVLIGELSNEDLNSWAKDAKNGNGVFAKFLTVRKLTAQEINTMLLDAGMLSVSGGIGCTSVNCSGTMLANNIDVNHVYISGEFELNILDAYISGNTLSFDRNTGSPVTITKSSDGKTLTFTDPSGGSFSFRKATKVSGSWSGDTLTLSAYDYGQELPYTTQISTAFYSSPTTPGNYQYGVAAYRQDNGALQPTQIGGTSQVFTLGTLAASPTTVRMLNSSGTSISNTPTYTIPIQPQKTITANGTYNPSSGNLGFESVYVNVPGYADPKTKFSASTGQYYIVATDGEGGNEISGSSITYQMGVLAASPTVVRLLNAAGTESVTGTTPTYTIPLETKSVSANGTYTPSDGKVGFSSVTVNVPASGYDNPKTKFSAATGQYYIVATDGEGGNEISGTSITYQMGVLAASPTVVRLLNASGTESVTGSTPTYTIPLEAKSVSANGTYSPSGNNVGFSSVTVNVPSSGYADPRTKFSASSGSYYIVATDGDGGNEISGSSTTYTMGVLSGSKTTVRLLNAAGTESIGSTPTYSIPLESKSVSANGTYSPSGNNVGFSSVTVNVPAGYSDPRTKFSASSGQYYIVATNGDGGNEISGSSTTYKLGLSGTTVQIQNSSGTQIGSTDSYSIPLETKSISSNGTYTPSSGNVGMSAVTVNVTPGSVGFSASSGQYYFICRDLQGNEISGTQVNYKLGESGSTVQIQDPNGSQISGTTTYTVPSRTVTITGTAIGNITNDHVEGTITVSGTGVTTKTEKMVLTAGSWNDGKVATNIRVGSSSGTLIARKWISVPSISESCTNPAAYNFMITASCGGKSVKYKLVVSSTGGKSSFTKQ